MIPQIAELLTGELLFLSKDLFEDSLKQVEIVFSEQIIVIECRTHLGQIVGPLAHPLIFENLDDDVVDFAVEHLQLWSNRSAVVVLGFIADVFLNVVFDRLILEVPVVLNSLAHDH